jgi:hypothetical protein
MWMLPTEWETETFGVDGRALVGFVGHCAHVVAPPGVAVHTGEADDDRAAWRHAVWSSNGDGEDPLLSVDQPDEVTALSTREVSQFLPEECAEFVREAMAEQMRRANTFGDARTGEWLVERYASESAEALSWYRTELDAAFPTEYWHRAGAPKMQMPENLDELLYEMPITVHDRVEPVRLVHRCRPGLRRWEGTARQLDATLAGRVDSIMTRVITVFSSGPRSVTEPQGALRFVVWIKNKLAAAPERHSQADPVSDQEPELLELCGPPSGNHR